MSFVGYSKERVSAEQLQTLLAQYAQGRSFYFLRWAHTVSGFWQYTADQFPHPDSLKGQFPSPEGQLFNAEVELRWKRQNQRYNVLLLQKSDSEPLDGFTKIPGCWGTSDRNANFYKSDVTRFPKEFTYPQELDIHQRYFIDTRTATVHFVALTLKDDQNTPT